MYCHVTCGNSFYDPLLLAIGLKIIGSDIYICILLFAYRCWAIASVVSEILALIAPDLRLITFNLKIHHRNCTRVAHYMKLLREENGNKHYVGYSAINVTSYNYIVGMNQGGYSFVDIANINPPIAARCAQWLVIRRHLTFSYINKWSQDKRRADRYST